MLEARTWRSKSVPPDKPFSSRYSRKRAEKNRSREESSKIADRCSIRTRISSSSVSVILTFPTACCFMAGALQRATLSRRDASLALALPVRAYWDRRTRVFRVLVGSPRAELRQSFVELLGQLHHISNGCRRLTRALGRLPRDSGNDLHRVRHAFRAPHLLLRSERNFLDQLG